MTKQEYNKQYDQVNKERLKEYLKQWYLDNKERLKEYQKQYHLANKDKINERKKEYSKKYNQANPEYQQQYHQSHQLPYHIVYLLPDHNYVGVTNNPYKRMNWHKNEAKRNTDNWVELARFDTEKEALKCEDEYHTKGYEGKKSA